jgi:hypothetical protein
MPHLKSCVLEIFDVEREDNIKPICIDMIHTNLLAQLQYIEDRQVKLVLDIVHN